MCNPVFVGMAIGGGMAAIQGGGIEEIAIGATLGGVGGAVGAGGISEGLTAFSSGTAGAQGGIFSSVGGSIFAEGVTTAAQYGAGGAMLGGLLNPQTPEFPTYNVPQQTAQVQQFNSQQIATTGSGGRQASASLAEAIKRSKQRKLSQADVGDLSIDTSSFASTGLQFA
jgi:hypothetical protein